MSTERRDFVKEVEALYRKSNCNDFTIKYGYVDYSQTYPGATRKGVFVESETDVNMDKDKREMVLVKYDNQHDMFGIMQSIEGDSTYAIITDIVKVVGRL